MRKTIHHFSVTHGVDTDVGGKDSFPPYLRTSPYILILNANANELPVKRNWVEISQLPLFVKMQIDRVKYEK